MKENDTAETVEEFSHRVAIASSSLAVGVILEAMSPDLGTLAFIVASVFMILSATAWLVAGSYRNLKEIDVPDKEP